MRQLQDTMRNRYVRSWLLAAAAGVLALAGWVAWSTSQPLPRRFAAVVPGRLYRSGAVSPAQLEYMRDRFGIRRVICLLDPSDERTQAERQAAERLNVAWHNVPLPGDATSMPAQRQELLRLLLDPDAPPTLVHCAAGVNRTGLAVGLYRIHHDGWTVDQVLAEMRQFGFEDLPKHRHLREALAAEAASQVQPGSRCKAGRGP